MFDVYSSVNIIFINFDKYLKFDISYIATLVWPPKRLRNHLVARGRKRLCTTAVSHHCNGLLLCPWLRPLLPPRPLLPSVGSGCTSGAAFCWEGGVFGPSCPFGYYAAKGLFRLWVHQHGMI